MRILVLCTGNSCRSQMLHGYLKSLLPEANVYSAGIESHGINPIAVGVMAEDKLDISTHQSTKVSEYKDISFDYIISVCDHAKEHCPVLLGEGKRIHHTFRDPAKAYGTANEVIEIFREVRNEIKVFAEKFTKEVD